MLNIPGLLSIAAFYLIMLGIGIWAARKSSKADLDSDHWIGKWLGFFTMTATWVGGGTITGTAEITYTRGLLWCQTPIFYGICLILGGLFFAKPMREKGYVTMLDPLQQHLGNRVGGFLYLPALCAELVFVAMVLAALGSSVSVILDWDRTTSILVSAAIAVGYTLFGGLYSVAYTDVFQLFCIFIGLWVTVPFAMTHEAVGPLSPTKMDWIGNVQTGEIVPMIDAALLMMLGGIPWQCYFQRVLSCKTSRGAQVLSYSAAFGSLFMAIPGTMLGGIARSTDWSLTAYGAENVNASDPIQRGDALLTLPLVIHHLTPSVVGLFGLGAVTAAMMSSADSAVLSAASMFARNMYRTIFRTGASETETRWALKGGILIVGAGGSLMALHASSVYSLSVISSDLNYVILFPQLLLVVHFPDHVNTYGSIVAYLIALVLRFASGEPQISLPALIEFPGYDPVKKIQGFPLRTFIMLLSLFTMVVVSKMVNWVFRAGILPPKYDIFKCVVNVEENGAIKKSDSNNENVT